MNIAQSFIGISIIFLLYGCSGPLSKLSEQAEIDYNKGDYEGAFSAWEEIITAREKNGKSVKGNIYALAGKSAFILEKNIVAIDYLEKARKSKYANEEVYLNLTKSYRRIDNLSKEITALENYVNTYSNGKEYMEMRIRLFETYIESENWEKAAELWSLIDEEEKSNLTLQEGYLLLNQGLGKNDVCDDIAKMLLKKDSNNIVALEYFANKYYWRAENLYKSEMDLYNRKKNHKQYAKLLKALKVVTADFKKARDYYKKLYAKDPNSEYARRLTNIYARLNDKEKSDYYRKRAK